MFVCFRESLGEGNAEDEGNIIEVTKFNANSVEKTEQRVIRAELVGGAHGGGDVLLMEDFVAQLENESGDGKTSIDRSIESHIMAFAAEEARVKGTVVDIDEVKARFVKEQ